MADIVEIKTGLDLESIRIAEEVAARDDFAGILINSSRDGIVAYDTGVRYTLWSPAMEKMSGLKSKDVLGRCAFEIFPFLRETRMKKAIQLSLEGRAVRSSMIPYLIPETGLRGYTQQQNFPLFDENGKVTGGLAIVRDVTAIKNQFDRLQERNRQLEARVEELDRALRAFQGPSEAGRSPA
jgi:PAS domain S-box-containing protein